MLLNLVQVLLCVIYFRCSLKLVVSNILTISIKYYLLVTITEFESPSCTYGSGSMYA